MFVEAGQRAASGKVWVGDYCGTGKDEVGDQCHVLRVSIIHQAQEHDEGGLNELRTTSDGYRTGKRVRG